MNRRKFLASVFVGAPAAAVAHKLGWWAALKEWWTAKAIPFGFVVGEDGLLSSPGGQDRFAVYGAHGGLAEGYMQYYWRNGHISSEYTTSWTELPFRPIYYGKVISLKDLKYNHTDINSPDWLKIERPSGY